MSLCVPKCFARLAETGNLGEVMWESGHEISESGLCTSRWYETNEPEAFIFEEIFPSLVVICKPQLTNLSFLKNNEGAEVISAFGIFKMFDFLLKKLAVVSK